MKTLFSVLLLAITAFAQNNRVLPKGAEIKVRTDSAIPAKPAAGASYGATISQDVTDTSGAVLIPRGSPARLVAVNNGKDTTLDLRSVTINGRSYLITVAGKSSSSGILELDEKWQTELQKAVLAVLGERLWVPPEVLLAFAQEMRILLDKQLLPGHSLTARESQVLQLLFRRLTNKEIARELEISVRTAKFHVCNLLNKLGLENRRNLLEGFGTVEST
jgi:DNA-binding CsgD family transcriptional regulator